MDKEKELKNVLQEICKSEVSLQKIAELYDKGKNILGDKFTDEEFRLAFSIFKEGAEKIGEFMMKWIIKKSIRPTDEELDLLEKAFSEASKIFNFLAENSSITKEVNELNQKKLQDSTDMVQQEKKLRQLEKELKNRQNSSQSSNFNNNSTSSTNLTNSSSNSNNDNNQGIEMLQSQISSLQSSISSLERSNQFQNSSIDDQQKKRELEELKLQLATFQKKLQSLQNKPDSSNNFSQLRKSNEINNVESKKDFPWVIVAPLGITVVIFGIIIAYLIGKKSKKE